MALAPDWHEEFESKPSTSHLPLFVHTSLQRRTILGEDLLSDDGSGSVEMQILCPDGQSGHGILRWLLGSLELVQRRRMSTNPGPRRTSPPGTMPRIGKPLHGQKKIMDGQSHREDVRNPAHSHPGSGAPVRGQGHRISLKLGTINKIHLEERDKKRARPSKRVEHLHLGICRHQHNG